MNRSSWSLMPCMFLLASCVLGPCDADFDEQRQVYLGVSDSLITTGREGHLGLGKYHLGSRDTIEDETGFQCHSENWCELVPATDRGTFWYENHRGHEGDTRQMVGNNDSIWMYWSYGTMKFIAVRHGWTGVTNRGIRIGDTREAFLAAYPEAIHLSQNPDYPVAGCDDMWVAEHLAVVCSEGKVAVMGLSEYTDWYHYAFYPGPWPIAAPQP